MFDYIELKLRELSSLLNDIAGGNEFFAAALLTFAVGSLGYYGPRVINFIKAQARRHLTTQLTLRGDENWENRDEVVFLMDFISKSIEGKERTLLLTMTNRALRLSAGYGNHFVKLMGRWTLVTLTTEVHGDKPRETIRITIPGRDTDYFRKLVKHYSDTKKEDSRRYVYKSNGKDSIRGSLIKPIPLDSVALEPETRQKIFVECERFFKGEEHFRKLGLPWKLTMLLHGMPGTGKSTIAKLIASIYSSNIHTVNLNEISGQGLNQMVSEVRRGDILLLEDIDTCKATHRRSEDKNGSGNVTDWEDGLSFTVDLTTLLNTLGGVEELDGVIIIMTTNHRNKLDPALVRAGRVEIDFEVPLITPKTLKTHLNKIFEMELPFPESFEETFPAIPACKVTDAIYKNHTYPENIVEYLIKENTLNLKELEVC